LFFLGPGQNQCVLVYFSIKIERLYSVTLCWFFMEMIITVDKTEWILRNVVWKYEIIRFYLKMCILSLNDNHANIKSLDIDAICLSNCFRLLQSFSLTIPDTLRSPITRFVIFNSQMTRIKKEKWQEQFISQFKMKEKTHEDLKIITKHKLYLKTFGNFKIVKLYYNVSW
jgi:hypothetical protein